MCQKEGKLCGDVARSMQQGDLSDNFGNYPLIPCFLFLNRVIIPQKVKASSALLLTDNYEESNSAVFGLNALDVGASWNAIC
jgi:hypothetical protein